MHNWIRPYEAAQILKLDISAFKKLIELETIKNKVDLAPGKTVYDEDEVRAYRRYLLVKKGA